MTKNTWRHGRIVLKAGMRLERYSESNPGWSVSVGDPGTKLAHAPPVLRGPDVAIIRKEREPKGSGAEGWLEGAPDVAVEMLGDSQSTASATAKALEYLAAGAQQVWLLDPEARQVIVLTPPDHVRVVPTDGELDGGDALPGFRCRVAELFE